MSNNFNTSLATAPSVGASASSDREGPHRISVVSDDQIRQLAATAAKSGYPRYCAVRPKPSNGSGRQRYEVVFYPTPDSTDTLEYRYSLIPETLSEAHPYPLGGPQYAELLLASCLAVDEQRSFSQQVGDEIHERGHNLDVQGAATARFMERLAAAVQQDMQSLQQTEDDIWPVDEKANGLIVNKAYLQRLVGIEMKYGPHRGAWTHRQMQEVDLVLQMGLRKFYAPPAVAGERSSHEWSFLDASGSVTLVADTYTYDLPDDFAMLAEPTLTFQQGSSVLYPPLPVVGEYQIRQRLQRTDASARPDMCAIRVKQPDASEGTRYEILFWPIPDQAYTLDFRYSINPYLLDDHTTLPLGGQPHMQTVIEAVLSAAEDRMGRPGPHTDMFLQRLAWSVAHDQKASAPHRLGMNVDMSDYPYGRFTSWHDCDENIVTYNGVEY